MEKSIVAKNITKKYKLYNGTKERLFDLITPRSYGKDFYALRGVSLEAEKGDVIGFIGINGSGKSTLSNIIAGIVPQSSGDVETNGQVSLIAVASGLKGDLTGRDNIELKCLMLGFNKKEIQDLESEIIDFSELGDFIDQPVKSYSSGMKSRLGFAISVNIDPDILIIDEALSVGDKAFAEKSLNKMREFKEQGKTMIFVSHSIGQMKKFCEKIVWLEFGKVKEYGDVEEVIPKYEAFLDTWQKLSKKERDMYRNASLNNDGAALKKFLNTESNSKIESFQEKPISRLGHIKGGESFIYSEADVNSNKIPSNKYKNSVYYIKKEATKKNEKFYLLSESPSALVGIVGWMKESDISSLPHVAVDEDNKTFYIAGKGAGFTHPWGGKKNAVYKDLEELSNSKFNVNKTHLIGNNIWYFGELQGNQIWIHEKFLNDEMK
ncbi:teichoic acids export ABC transporter ATP-binding subunit TagH [Virgibacillus flavescens]|uniref:teichoic acids export ABC transporter ATP-binding subunit TagH n=1 Tax=Virgibacillus flavescens TaxID=1611422 RepID=UPI003D3520CF